MRHLTVTGGPQTVLPSKEGNDEMTKADELKARKSELRISRGMLILGVVGLLYTVGHDFFQSRSSDRRFGNIETALRILTQTVAPQVYKSIDDSLNAALNQNDADAAKTLNSTQVAIKRLNDLQVVPDNTQLVQSGTSLVHVVNAHPNLPETWRVAGQLIDYRFAPNASKSLPDCQPSGTTASLQKNLFYPPNSEPTGYIFAGFTLSNCTLRLDDPASILRTKSIQFASQTKGIAFALQLINVHVVYHGGAIIPVRALVFQNCTFEFEVNAPPPAPMSQMMETLLATQDPSDIRFIEG